MRHVRHQVRGCRGERRRIEPVARHGERRRARDEPAHEHLGARDVVAGQRQHPLSRAAERVVGRVGARDEGLGRECDPLRGVGRAARLDHERDAVADLGRERVVHVASASFPVIKVG